MLRRLLVTLVFSFLLLLAAVASTASDAEKLYRSENYAQAELLYAKLLRNSPTHRIYNHRYGVCLYEQGKDLAKAEKHLLKSQKQGISLSSYYLGRVCFLQYKFDKAIAHYQRYLEKSTDKELKLTVQSDLPQCEQGKLMIQRTEDVEIIDRVEVDREAFFLHYNVSEEAGSFLKDAAGIGEDIIADNTTIYTTERGDRAFFSLSDEEGHSSIYSKNRLLDQWSEKTSLGENVNSSSDEAYPFLMSDGVVLYFSSKGHNSLGGYDIYVTRYNANKDAYLPPQQLSMPFNSLGDDILFAIDEYNNIGWFASDRDSEDGKIAIYTFVPNTTIKLLDTDDEQVRIDAARISNITSTPTDTTESTHVDVTLVANKPMPEERKIYFVVNDTLIYSSLNDFMNLDAMNLYVEYESASLYYDSISVAVKEKRLQYSKTLDSNEKGALIAEIMKLEEASFAAEEDRDKLLLATRRLEQETIRANGGYSREISKAVAPETVRTEVPEKHVSPWEAEPATVDKELVTKPFFYAETLYAYYDQIYSQEAIDKLIEANQLKAEAADKQFFADYVMREYNRPEPSEAFFAKVMSYDTTMTRSLTRNEMLAKIEAITDEAVLLFIESSYLSYFTLKGQNVLLLETVTDENYRKQIKDVMGKAAFAMQQADQKIYVSEGVYTTNSQHMAQGNSFLKEAIQHLESTSLTYLKHRYEEQNTPKEVEVAPVVVAPVNNKPVDTVNTIEAVEPTVEIVEKDEPIVITPSVEYRIQFGIFSRILTDEDTKGLADVSYYQYSEQALYKYFSGHFATQEDADMGLDVVKANGHKDAFVVKFVDGVLEK